MATALRTTKEPSCRCLGITEETVRRAIREHGLTSVREITKVTEAGDGCMNCHPVLRAMLEEENAFIWAVRRSARRDSSEARLP